MTDKERQLEREAEQIYYQASRIAELLGDGFIYSDDVVSIRRGIDVRIHIADPNHKPRWWQLHRSIEVFRGHPYGWGNCYMSLDIFRKGDWISHIESLDQQILETRYKPVG